MLLCIVYQLAAGETNLDYDPFQQMHSPLLWNKLHKPIYKGRHGYEAHVNISLLCDTITVLYETKAISSQLFTELRGLCVEEQSFINALDKICQQSVAGAETVIAEVLTFVASTILLGAAGVGLVESSRVGLGAAGLGTATSTMLEQKEQAKKIDQLFNRTDNLKIDEKDIVE